jgi:uncharacterized RDD family membrane protein YckC
LPALVLIPLRWVAGHDLPMGHLVLIVATLATLAYAASTLILARLSGVPRPRQMGLVIVFQFMLCPFWAIPLSRIAIYEAGVFFAQLCMSLALLSVVVAFDQRLSHGKARVWLLALGSVFLGLMVNCRLNLAPLGLMVPVVLYLWLNIGPRPIRWRSAIGPAMALGGPAAFFLACALTYNQLRFGSFFEVGQSWQLWGGHDSMWKNKFHYLEFGRLIPNIWYYFFSPVTTSPNFAHVFVPVSQPPRSWMSSEMLAVYDEYADPMSGLFIVLPLATIGLFAPLRFLRKPGGVVAERARSVMLMLLICGLLSGFPLFLAPPVMRYGAEWCMWWLMISILTAFQIRARLRAGACRIGSVLFDFALLSSTIWSSWIGVSFLIYRYGGSL